MQRTKTLLRLFAVAAVFGLAMLALPFSAQAGVRVSIGVGVPVYPAPVIVAPAPAVVYPAPVIVTQPFVVVAPPVVYGSPPVWGKGSYGHRCRHWRHRHPHSHRW